MKDDYGRLTMEFLVALETEMTISDPHAKVDMLSPSNEFIHGKIDCNNALKNFAEDRIDITYKSDDASVRVSFSCFEGITTFVAPAMHVKDYDCSKDFFAALSDNLEKFTGADLGKGRIVNKMPSFQCI